MKTISKDSPETTEEFLENVATYLSHVSERMDDEDKIALFDELMINFCRDVAAALDSELSVWALKESDPGSPFHRLLSGPRVTLEEGSETSPLLDEVFRRTMVAVNRQSHSEREVSSPEHLVNQLMDTFGIRVTSMMTTKFGKPGSLEGIVTAYRFTDSDGRSPFGVAHFETEDQGRFEFYVRVLNRLIDQAYLRLALGK